MIKSNTIMKRDMDLIRKLLLAIEADEHGYVLKEIEIEGYTQEEIGYHVVLLGEANLAKVTEETGRKNPQAIIKRLTWEGHEFLDASRENNTWNQAKDKIGKIGGATIPVWMALLTDIIKAKIGLVQ